MYIEPNTVLIETYWNVKEGGVLLSESSTSVLIETYWNVKKLRAQITD